MHDFPRHLFGRSGLIMAPYGHKHDQARTDLARDLIGDNDPRTADPLNDGSHLAILPCRGAVAFAERDAYDERAS
jgi:hypothetical protein